MWSSCLFQKNFHYSRFDRNCDNTESATNHSEPGPLGEALDRGFFEVSHAPPHRPEGVPLSEQHKITTTIAANVSSENRPRAADLVRPPNAQFNHTNEEDFPDLASTNSESTSFWSSFNSKSMKGIDWMKEANYPALPQTDAPTTRGGKNKKLNTNNHMKGSPWNGPQATESTSNSQPSTELSSISDSLTHQLSLSNATQGTSMKAKSSSQTF